jgi:hypothetical protein
MFYPHGGVPYYWPTATGAGDAWKLPSVSAPLAPIKNKLVMLGGVSNYSPFGGHVEPSHGNVCAAAWTCTRGNGPGNAYAGTSVDQAIAKTIGGATALPSLQVGLSTLDSSPEGMPPQHSRSISWSDPQTPLYKVVNPQAVFDRLVAGTAPASTNAGDAPDPVAERRRLLRKSSLDYLVESTTSLQTRVSRSDRARLDKLLGSVRALEQRVALPPMQVRAAMQASCPTPPRPTEIYNVGTSAAATQTEGYSGDGPPAGYDRGHHADLMIDLVVLALQCDMTRVVSFMIDDERSDFSYNFLAGRSFTATDSTPNAAVEVTGAHGMQHCDEFHNGWLTVLHWNMQKATRLASALDAIRDDDGSTILDNTVITFASSMRAGPHDSKDTPVALLGGGGGVLKQNLYQRWPTESPMNLADVHLLLMQKVFGCPDQTFGTPYAGSAYTHGVTLPTEILA